MTRGDGARANPLAISFGLHGACVVLRLRGELDLDTTPRLRRSIDEALEMVVASGLVIDFEEVLFCDSTGIGVLVYARGRMLALGGRLVLSAVSAPVMQLLGRTSLAHHVECRPTVHEALEALASATP